MRSRHPAAAARPPVGGRGRLPGQLGVPRLAAYDARVPRRTALQSFSSDLRRSYWDFSGFLASQADGGLQLGPAAEVGLEHLGHADLLVGCLAVLDDGR